MESCNSLHSDPAFYENIRLRRKWIKMENTLAYYNTATITTVKNFIVQALGDLMEQHA